MPEIFVRALVLVLVFAAVIIAVERALAMAASRRGEGKAINKRLDMIGKGMSSAETLSALRRQTFDPSGSLPAPLVGAGARLNRLLVQAGVLAPTGQLLMLLMAIPILLFLIFILLLMFTGAGISTGRIFLMMVMAVVIGGLIPVMVLRFIANRKRKRMQDQFPVALDVFVRGLRAGHPVAAALDLLTIEMPDPIGSEFGLVVDEVTYGADLRDALEAMAERWDLDDIRMFVVSLSVQNETGGNLAEILENLSGVIRERAAMMMKVRALSSEGRMTALMLSILPLMALTILFIGNPRFFLDVSDDPLFIPAFAILILMWTIGVAIIRKMIDLKV